MGLNFKKKAVVGVSVTPDIGIEVAQIDYENHRILNYVSKPFVFDSKLKGNFDLDIFKETLFDALVEIGAPQGTEIVLNFPSTVFDVKDLPAAIENNQLSNNVEDSVLEHPYFSDNTDDPLFSYCVLPNSTIQSKKVVHTALPKSIILEIAIQIKDLKYNLIAIDTSVNSTLNALIYSGRVDVSPDKFWVMLIVDNNYCRVVSMQGRNYVTSSEETISIGKVLDDSENYSVVVNAVAPILKNTPSSLLYVVSKTDIISAEVLASKLTYKAPIVHQEDNIYNKVPYLEQADETEAEDNKIATLDVIGAAVKRDFGTESSAPLNLFNSQLGDIYFSQTYPIFHGIELSLENMLRYAGIIAAIIIVLTLIITSSIKTQKVSKEHKIKDFNTKIEEINQYLKDHEDISAQQFSETDEIRIGLSNNKNVYSYYTIVGTEIPKKLWLTSLQLGDHVTIEGQADNLESVYAFFRNIKDYNPSSAIKLQKLGLAGKNKIKGFSEIAGDNFDTESVLTSLNADFYEFVISDKSPEVESEEKSETETPKKSDDKKQNNNNKKLPKLEPLE